MHRFGEMFFFIFFALRDERFYRICLVINGLKYINTSAPLMPRIFVKLVNCRIQVNQKVPVAYNSIFMLTIRRLKHDRLKTLRSLIKLHESNRKHSLQIQGGSRE